MKKISTSVLFIIIVFFANSQFSNPVEITAVRENTNIVTDFDQDGDPDIIAVGENLFCFENDGTGNFEKRQLTQNWHYSSVAYVIARDFDDDGYPDLLYYDLMTPKLTCFFNDGNMGLGPEQIILDEMIAFNTNDSYISDINGDGTMDFLYKITSDPNVLRVILNQGNHQFEQSTIAFSTTINSFADLDADGDTDVLLGYSGSYHIASNDGNGNFQITNNFTFLDYITNPIYADLDADNDLDLLFKDMGYLKVIRNLGNGQLSASESYTIGQDVGVNMTSDINYDGYPDVLLSGQNYCGYMLNSGGNSFSALQSFNLSPDSGSSWLNSYSGVADFDGNGYLDLFTKNEWLFFSNGPLSFEPGIRYADKFTNKMQLMDVNTDNVPDLIYVQGDVLCYRLAVGDGVFSPVADTIGLLSGYPDQIVEMVVTDFNLDGLQDLFYRIPLLNGTNGFRLLVNDGSGNFTTIPAGEQWYVSDVRIANVDNDNYPDIVFRGLGGLQWKRNMGNLSFSSAILISSDSYSGGFECADLDGDTDIDVLLKRSVGDNYEFVYLSNDGSGVFGAPVIIIQDTGMAFEPFIVSDFNADGNTDVAYVHSVFENGAMHDFLHMYHGNGSGGYTFSDAAVTFYPGGTKLADVNRDNLTDICFLGNNQKVMVHFQNQNGEFSDGYIFPELIEVPGYQIEFVGTDNDMLIRGAFNGIYYAENQFKHYLQGKLFVDNDLNGQSDAGESSIPNHAVHAMPQNAFYFSAENGNFSVFNLSEGQNTVDPLEISNFQLTTNPAQFVFNASDLVDSVFHCEFGYIPLNNVDSLLITLTAGIPRCDMLSNYWIRVNNYGSTQPYGNLMLQLDSLVTFVSSGIVPDSIIGQQVFWHFDSLDYFESIVMNVVVQMPDFNSMGDTLLSSIRLMAANTSGNGLLIYEDSVSQVLACAYDPNDKTVIPAGSGEDGYLPVENEWLEYVVRFQNTGNDTAINVVITDQLDEAIDIESLELIASSHPVEVMVTADGMARFTHAFINLPDSLTNESGSQGFVRYRVHLKDNARIDGRQIQNTAFIYFDFNPPVVTNTVLTTLYACDDTFQIILPEMVCLSSEVSGSIESELIDASVIWTTGNISQTGSLFSWFPTYTGVHDVDVLIETEWCSYGSGLQVQVIAASTVMIDPVLQDTICWQNETMNLPAAIPPGGEWSGENVVGSTFDPSIGDVGSYPVIYTYTDSSGCMSTDSIQIVVEDCAGIIEFENEGIRLYPNPFYTTLTIELEKDLAIDYSIEISDLNGIKVYHADNLTQKIMVLNLEDISDGVYIIRVQQSGSGQNVIKRVVKQ